MIVDNKLTINELQISPLWELNNNKSDLVLFSTYPNTDINNSNTYIQNLIKLIYYYIVQRLFYDPSFEYDTLKSQFINIAFYLTNTPEHLQYKEQICNDVIIPTLYQYINTDLSDLITPQQIFYDINENIINIDFTLNNDRPDLIFRISIKVEQQFQNQNNIQLR